MTRSTASSSRPPLTLPAGVALILAAGMLLIIDVAHRGGVWAIVPDVDLPEPGTALERLGRWGAINMTPLCWTGYLLALDGLLVLLGRRGVQHGVSGPHGSPIRRRPARFIFCFLTSIPVWVFFDWINFSFLHAWDYHNLPESFTRRMAGYFVAFGAITPAMLLTAEVARQSGVTARGRGAPIGRITLTVLIGLGAVFLAVPFITQRPIGTLTLWLAVALLLDPLNDWLGAPSIVGDWRAGRYGRTIALLVGGLACGFLWEFWNYWAVAKWTYSLPFLGPLESVRLFEMPLLGFLGFLPFAIECWAAFQTFAALGARLGLRRLAQRPDDPSIL